MKCFIVLSIILAVAYGADVYDPEVELREWIFAEKKCDKITMQATVKNVIYISAYIIG